MEKISVNGSLGRSNGRLNNSVACFLLRLRDLCLPLEIWPVRVVKDEDVGGLSMSHRVHLQLRTPRVSSLIGY